MLLMRKSVKNAWVKLYFLRGYNYYRLFAQYGGVVLQTQVTEGVVRTFTRASAEETLNQVIDDLQNAYDKLPTDRWRGTGYMD